MKGYNPFSGESVIRTKHGFINKEKSRYFTHRRSRHFFRKYKGFGISEDELEICFSENIKWVFIKYVGVEKNTIYRIKLELIKYMDKYDNDGDMQYIIPVGEMEVVGEEIVKKGETNKEGV